MRGRGQHQTLAGDCYTCKTQLARPEVNSSERMPGQPQSNQMRPPPPLEPQGAVSRIVWQPQNEQKRYLSDTAGIKKASGQAHWPRGQVERYQGFGSRIASSMEMHAPDGHANLSPTVRAPRRDFQKRVAAPE